MLSIQEKITNGIIEALKGGVKPWACPWKVEGMNTPPINFVTGNSYSGINAVSLWYQSYKHGYTSNAWLTFLQAKQLNGHIIKGSEGTPCVFYALKEGIDEKTGETKRVPLIKPFTVFNLDQIDGIKRRSAPPKDSQFESIETGERLLAASQAKIMLGGERAFYNRHADIIGLPERSAFHSSRDFYATALHELIHWTGHETRLNRKMGEHFADPDYVFEEFVAELGSAFLCSGIGLQGNLEQHASYIDSWLKILQTDSRAIFRAASLATKAQAFLTALFESADQSKVKKLG